MAASDLPRNGDRGFSKKESDAGNQLLPFSPVAASAQGLQIAVVRIPSATQRNDVIDLEVPGTPAAAAASAVPDEYQCPDPIAQWPAFDCFTGLLTLQL